MKKLSSFILIILFVLPTFHSCNEDANPMIYSTENLDEYKSPEFFRNSVIIVSEKIIEKIEKNRGNESIELTQQELDDFVSASGYNGTMLSLNEVNNIINLVLDEFNSGNIVFPIEIGPEFPPISGKANDLLVLIGTNGSIDLKANPDFNLLDISEQDIIDYVNNIIMAYENGEIDFNFTTRDPAMCSIRDGQGNGGHAPCFIAGMMAGGLIGNSIGGTVGMIVGGIIGGVVGALIGGS